MTLEEIMNYQPIGCACTEELNAWTAMVEVARANVDNREIVEAVWNKVSEIVGDDTPCPEDSAYALRLLDGGDLES